MKGVIVSAEGASYLSPGQRPGSGEVEEAPRDALPKVQEVLDLLHDLDQAHRGGHLEREEFQARKKELLARIRRGRA